MWILLLSLMARAQEAPSLAGTWRADLEIQNQVSVPVLGDSFVENHQLFRVELAPQGSGWVQKHEVCDIWAEARGIVGRTVIPRSFIRAVPRKVYPAMLQPGPTGWRYEADLLPTMMGYDPQRSGGVLPESEEAPGVVDMDGDGHPGVTVQAELPVLGMVDIYVVQLTRIRLQGRVISADLIEGEMWLTEMAQRAIGASNRLFASNPQIRSVPGSGRFRMQRVPEGTGCAELRRPG